MNDFGYAVLPDVHNFVGVCREAERVYVVVSEMVLAEPWFGPPTKLFINKDIAA